MRNTKSHIALSILMTRTDVKFARNVTYSSYPSLRSYWNLCNSQIIKHTIRATVSLKLDTETTNCKWISQLQTQNLLLFNQYVSGICTTLERFKTAVHVLPKRPLLLHTATLTFTCTWYVTCLGWILAGAISTSVRPTTRYEWVYNLCFFLQTCQKFLATWFVFCRYWNQISVRKYAFDPITYFINFNFTLLLVGEVIVMGT